MRRRPPVGVAPLSGGCADRIPKIAASEGPLSDGCAKGEGQTARVGYGFQSRRSAAFISCFRCSPTMPKKAPLLSLQSWPSAEVCEMCHETLSKRRQPALSYGQSKLPSLKCKRKFEQWCRQLNKSICSGRDSADGLLRLSSIMTR